MSPAVGICTVARPLLACRQIADDRVVPDIDALAGAEVVNREFDTPVEITGDRSVEQALLIDPAPHEIQNVGTPVGLVGEVGTDLGREIGIAEVEVFGLSQHRGGLGKLRPRVDQVGGIERAAALVALITASVVIGTVRTGALDVAIGQKALDVGIEELLTGALVDVPVVQLLQEHLLGDPSVVRRAGGGVVVPADAECLPLAKEFLVIAVGDVLGRHTLVVGTNRDRGSMHVGPADHQDLVAHQTLVASEDVGGEVRARDVPQMPRTRGIGPCNSDEYRGAHCC